MFMILFTRVNYYRSCAPGVGHNLIWEFLTFFGWIGLSALYCIIVVIWVSIKLFSITRNIDNPALINKTVTSNIVKRVVLYPLVPMVPMLFISIVETYANINNEIPFSLHILCYVGISLQGNLSFFFVLFFITLFLFCSLLLFFCSPKFLYLS